ncbi:MAG: AraC family transcriptional regulator [Chryseolinea sp.]
MIYKEFVPCAQLRPFVESFLLTNFEAEQGCHPVKPYPVRIEQALVFFARGYIEANEVQTGHRSRIAPNALFGQQVSRLDFHTYSDPDFLMLMVIFRPGGLHQLLGVPSHELTKNFIDAGLLLSSELQKVNDRIANSRSYAEMITCAEHFLIRQCKNATIGNNPVDRIAEVLTESPWKFSLDWLACQANLSPRQFERRFKDRMGVGPKFYSRISRFSKAFLFKEANPAIDWLSVSLRFGYTDYNHLCKDFKQFANTTPNIMIQEYSQRPEAVLFEKDSNDN